MQTDVKGDFIPGKTRIKYGGSYISADERAAINGVLDRNWWTIDAEGRLLEEEVARFLGLTAPKAATLVNSGSAALIVAYAALDFPEGSEIITGGVQFPTAISSMYYTRLTPVYVDVSPDNLCADPDLIEAAITEKTRAILMVAIAGNIPEIDRMVAIAKKHRLTLILDNCDGFGGTWNGAPIESYATIAATSFHAAHITSMGEGGVVMTNDPGLAARARALREWGRYGDTDEVPPIEGIPSDYPGRYVFQYMGFNMKPIELQCAMGRVQLTKLADIKARRLANWTQLNEGLKDLDAAGHIRLPRVFRQAVPSWFGFPLMAKDRPGLRTFLESRNIETRTIFGGNITKQPAFRNFGRIVGDLTVSDQVMIEGMFISVHPSNTPEMNDYMIRSFHDYYDGTR